MESCNLKKIALVAVVLNSVQGFAAWNSTGSSLPAAVQIQVLSNTSQETVLEYRVSGFDLETIEVNGKSYSMISIPSANSIEEAGYPVLPRVSRNVHIPYGSQASLEVADVQTQSFTVAPVLPSKGELTRNIDPNTVPLTFAPEIYQSTERAFDFPSTQFSMGEEFQIRTARGVNVTFNPIQYDAASGSIKVVTHAIVKVRTSSVRGMLAPKADLVDAGWEGILKGSFLNGEEMIRDASERTSRSVDSRLSHFIRDTGRVLVITPAGFKASLAPWLKWKTQKGLQVWVSEVATTNYQEIKALVQKAYDQLKVSYVILVGDSEFVPFHKGVSGNAAGAEADPMYGLVEGNDSYPDLSVSRFSVKTTQELDVMVAKAVSYEATPDQKGEWYSKTVAIASDEGSPKDWERAEVFMKLLAGWHYKVGYKQYDPKASKTELAKQINDGLGFINYIGHGSKASWGTTGFSNWDVDQLTNVGKLPFIVSVACVNGQFGAGSDSFAERWTKVGTVQAPRGAIAIFASSTNQSWVPPTVGQLEINKLLVSQSVNTIGSLFFHGSIAVLEDNSSTAKQTFETWHIFGDATTQVRTQPPSDIQAQVPSEISASAGELVVQVPAKGIQAGLMQGDRLIGAGISDGSGTMKIKIYNQGLPSNAGMSKDPLLLTLTGFNKTPKYTQISVR